MSSIDSDDDEQLPSPPVEGDEDEDDEQLPSPPVEGNEHKIPQNTFLDKKFFVDRDVFMKALQDPGCINPASKEERKIHYPKLKTVANKIFDKLKSEKFPDIPGNKTRVSPIIVNCILKLRKVVGVHEVNQIFRSYVSDTSSTEIFIIHNHENYFGYNRLLQEIHFYFDRKKVLKQDDRTPSDAVRVAAIMLHKDNLKAVQSILSGSRPDRAACDQSVPPKQAWAMDAVKLFKDPSFQVEAPEDMQLEDATRCDCDPNDVNRMTKCRNGQWFLDTWSKYLKKKYQMAIRKWDTVTGGGSHDPWEFSKFCGRDTWLVWVYMMDMKNGFLLFSIAKGTPPEHVGAEPGSEHLLHLIGKPVEGGGSAEADSPSCGKSSSQRKKNKLDAVRKEFVARQKKVDVLLDEFTDYFRKKKAITTETSDLLHQICEAQKRKRIAEESASWMSPTSKRIFMRAASNDVKALQKKVIEQERTKEQLEDASSVSSTSIE